MPVLCWIVLVGLGLGVGEGLGLGNQVAISTRGGNNLAGVENGHNTGMHEKVLYSTCAYRPINTGPAIKGVMNWETKIRVHNARTLWLLHTQGRAATHNMPNIKNERITMKKIIIL